MPHHRRANPSQQPARTRRRFHANATIPDEHGCKTVGSLNVARFPDVPVSWCHGDVLTHLLEPDSFDAVLSNAALHHLPDTRAALRRLTQLVRPGGTLAIVGLTRTEWCEWPWALAAFISLGAASRLHGKREHTAPQAWPPMDTFRQLARSFPALTSATCSWDVTCLVRTVSSEPS